MPRTKEKEYGLWRTPDANCDRGPSSEKRMQWKYDKGMPISLNDQVKHGMWPTPKASLRGDCPSERERNTPDLPSAAKMWSTPAANDGKNGTLPASQIGRDTLVGDVMKASMWPTPRANKPEGYSSAEFRPTLAQVATGEEKPIHGQLNPDWVDTLMGFPAGWSEPDCDEPQEIPFPAPMGCEQYEWEPPLVATNCPNRANRLKADGNAVIPQIPEIFGRLIMAVEGGANP
jgi:DNA (cytosine-5)-methyltransferase 1